MRDGFGCRRAAHDIICRLASVPAFNVRDWRAIGSRLHRGTESWRSTQVVQLHDWPFSLFSAHVRSRHSNLPIA